MNNVLVRILGVATVTMTLAVGACSSTTESGSSSGSSSTDSGAGDNDAGGQPAADSGKDAATGADSSSTKACPARQGLYDYTATPVSGNCGTSPFNAAFTYDGCTQNFCLPYTADAKGLTKAGDVFPACVGTVSPSADGCTTGYDYTCTLASGDKIKVVGATKWTADGTTGSESKQAFTSFTPDGTPDCSGQYQITIQKK